MAERYLFQNGFVKYLINNSGSSYVKKDGGIQTLKNMTKKNKNKFNAQFSPISHLSRATIQKEEGYDHFLDLNKTSYDCPYNPSFYKVTSFYFVYKIRGYDHTEPENNYLVSFEVDYYGLCFLRDEATMRIRGVQAEKHARWKDISNFPTSYYNPCRKDIWNVVCLTFDVKTPSNSSLCVNHGKICNFTCHTPMRDCAINFYNNAVPTNASGFNGFVIGLNLFHHYESVPDGHNPT